MLALLGALVDEGFDVALPVVTGRGTHLDFRLWRPGEPTALGPMGIPEPLQDAPRRSIRISCSRRSPASTGAAGASATARDTTTAALRASGP